MIRPARQIKTYLKQGITPDNLALSIVFGASFGTIPIIGVSALICFWLALVFRLNLAVIQFFNFLFYPVQLLTIYPMIWLGCAVFKPSARPDSSERFRQTLNEAWWKPLVLFAEAHVYGLLTWFLIILPIAVVSYFILRRRLSGLMLSMQD